MPASSPKRSLLERNIDIAPIDRQDHLRKPRQSLARLCGFPRDRRLTTRQCIDSSNQGGPDRRSELTLDWIRQRATWLRASGTILLYRASAIVEGQDRLEDALDGDLPRSGFAVCYRELDPDIFSGMFWRPTYRRVDRIAAITMVATRRG